MLTSNKTETVIKCPSDGCQFRQIAIAHVMESFTDRRICWRTQKEAQCKHWLYLWNEPCRI